MARRLRTNDPRIPVAVSGAMARLRTIQGALNGFWQTSELAYGYVLSHADALSKDPDRPTIELLGHIESQVWFPNNQGQIKRSDTIFNTLNQVRANTVHAYRATLLSYYSAFEAYLDAEASNFKRKGDSWGPFARSLSSPHLRSVRCPLPLRTVLCADFCRLVRNKMTHESFSVPAGLLDEQVIEWKRRLRIQACESGWAETEVAAAVDYAANQVIGQAARQVEIAKTEKKTLPLEYFFMLFNFTNLDNLACSVEEALQPERARPGSYVWRKQSLVRRSDLVIGEDELKTIQHP